MSKTICLFAFLFLFCNVQGQEKIKIDTSIARVLQSMTNFSARENNRDSALGHILGSNTEEDARRVYQFYDSAYTALRRIDPSQLNFDDQVNLELLKYDVEEQLSNYKYKMYLNPILADEGFHTGLASMGSQVRTKKSEFDAYIRRLKDIPRFVNENLALMRKGLSLGICQPAVILQGYENTYDQHIVNDVTQSVFWKPFREKPLAIDDTAWTRISKEGREAVQDGAIASYKTIKIFFEKEYLPATRKTIGVSNFPDGLAFYQDRTRHYTTTDLSYEEVYQIGLQEVARISGEMQAVMKEVKFKGDFKAFIKFLRTDPRFYAPTAEQLLKEASYIAKQADGMLPQFFGKLPRQPYGVEPVPAHLAPTYTAGRYAGASIHSKRAGHYWVNTYDLKSRPLYALEALTMHEAVPGHHLQIALAQELKDLPPFRRNLYVNAFGEGWGLYCEYLGTEMGFYKDPYSHFGRLTYEMWRACRLVIDVGLHTKGWTREQAVQYLADNTALSLHEVNTEINRYISWPGQALAYKMGELQIRKLRLRAEKQLKEKFDIREFHDLILSQGSVTLKIMAMMVNRYIEEKLAKN